MDERIRASPLWAELRSVLTQLLLTREPHPHDALLYPPAKPSATAPPNRPVKGMNASVPSSRLAELFDISKAPPAPPQPEERGSVTDMVAHVSLLASVGIGIPPAEAAAISAGLAHVLATRPVLRVRFWGRVSTRAGAYWVAEAEPNLDQTDAAEDAPDAVTATSGVEALGMPGAPRPARVPPAEQLGMYGTNQHVYYCASSTAPLAWVELPRASPAHIQAARRIRHLFSGDLAAPVPSHPRFPGKEAHYLRAQIARITFASAAAPADSLVVPGAPPAPPADAAAPPPVPATSDVTPPQPRDPPDEGDDVAWAASAGWRGGYAGEELTAAREWCHTMPPLLQGSGRASFWAPPPEGDEAEAAAEPAPELVPPQLARVHWDTPVLGAGGWRSEAWAARAAPRLATAQKRVYALRSLRWPGAVSVATCTAGTPGAQVVFAYCGDGLKCAVEDAAVVRAALLPSAMPPDPPLPPPPIADPTPAAEAEFAPRPPPPDAQEEGME